MHNYKKFRDILEKSYVVRFPRYRLSTFGTTDIHYNLISAVSMIPPLSNLRTGLVTALRPQIVTPDRLPKQVFEGFGDQSEKFEKPSSNCGINLPRELIQLLLTHSRTYFSSLPLRNGSETGMRFFSIFTSAAAIV